LISFVTKINKLRIKFNDMARKRNIGVEKNDVADAIPTI